MLKVLGIISLHSLQHPCKVGQYYAPHVMNWGTEVKAESCLRPSHELMAQRFELGTFWLDFVPMTFVAEPLNRFCGSNMSYKYRQGQIRFIHL